MQSITKLLDLKMPVKQGAFFRVLPISYNFFCVYAGTALIDIYADWVTANAHCQRLRNQQVVG
jgi:hypothetical protein